MSRMWHYSQNGRPQNPVPEEQLRAMLANGALRPEDMVWREGMAAWASAGQVPELAPAPVPYYPPPPPPQAFPAPSPYQAPNPFPTPSYQAPNPFPAPGYAQTASQGSISSVAVEMLRKTKPWARFLGVLGAIGLVFMVFAALFMAVGVTPPFNSMPVGPRLAAAFVYILMALLYLPPVIFLNRYASRIGDMVQSGDITDMEEALRAQKSFWKYVGIMALIGLLLGLIAVPIAIVLPMLLAGR